MAHLNGHGLKRWEKGDRLGADQLNANFTALWEMAESAMLEAKLPDAEIVALERNLSLALLRIKALEDLTAMHARQRNEREWAPLSHVGALVQMVNQVNQRFEAAVRRLDDMHASISVDHDDLHRRILRLEQQPEAARQEDFAVLFQDHERLALKEHMLLAQIIALRHEVIILRDLALGKDRQANRLEYAPLSYVGHTLQRLKAIEERLDGQA